MLGDETEKVEVADGDFHAGEVGNFQQLVGVAGVCQRRLSEHGVVVRKERQRCGSTDLAIVLENRFRPTGIIDGGNGRNAVRAYRLGVFRQFDAIECGNAAHMDDRRNTAGRGLDGEFGHLLSLGDAEGGTLPG